MKDRVFIKHESTWFRAHGWSTSLKAALGDTTHHWWRKMENRKRKTGGQTWGDWRNHSDPKFVLENSSYVLESRGAALCIKPMLNVTKWRQARFQSQRVHDSWRAFRGLSVRSWSPRPWLQGTPHLCLRFLSLLFREVESFQSDGRIIIIWKYDTAAGW
jgi:hypothetical protein